MNNIGILSNFQQVNLGKRPLGRPRRRWEDNIGRDLKEMGVSTRNWIDSAQNRDHRKAL